MSQEVEPTSLPTSRLTRKGQVTIPVSIRRRLGIGPNDLVTFQASNGEVRIVPVQGAVARTAGMLAGERPMLSPKEERIEAERAWADDAEGHA